MARQREREGEWVRRDEFVVRPAPLEVINKTEIPLVQLQLKWAAALANVS